ncbi:Cytochrome b-c1 complex subunit 7, mitochondrial [Hanseniaspora opuntiae]|jgi:ubiquinol-cytochrome c reductase subunit 7|uniref:Cytochrome b-c1 complex subunit 7 n=1 Tax=Hanseniaspora opuntiae TaxID=211096 RepID=A0A1E5RW98_9ASCO|nr:Cytochrome b-c1 complex subunit 7 [Hanseniaspora opuntiae]
MAQSFTSIVKAVSYINSKPALNKVVSPLAKGFKYLSGYRELGLKMNDLIHEENDITETALRRLPKDLQYERIYRIVQAHQLELTHHILPKEKQMKAENDDNYLLPYLLEAEAEAIEREQLDNLEVK